MSDMETAGDVHVVRHKTRDGACYWQMKKNDARRLMRWYWVILCVACERWGVWPGEVLNVRRKRPEIARAREDVGTEIRRTVFWDLRTHVLTIDEDGKRPSGAGCVSTPFVGRLMGLDHSTIVIGCQKRRRRVETIDVELVDANT